MKEEILRRAAAYARDCRAEQRELLCTLARLPAPTGAEEARAVFCRDWLRAQGMPQARIDEAGNVVCLVGYPDARDLAVFAAHTDIVFPDTDALPMHEADGKLYAPGIGDDTANLVHLLMAAKYLIENRCRLTCGVLIVANACEEGLGNLDGVKALFTDYGARIKAFYSFDGYTPQCCSCAVGSYRYRIRCQAAGGHSYLNFGEPNAIAILCRLVDRLYAIEAPTQVKTTYNVGRIEGGSTVNSIAEVCEMLYEFRSTSQACLEEMERKFHQAVDSCRDLGGTLTVELLGVRPGNGPVDDAALAAMTAKSAAVIGKFYDGPIDFAPYSTDSNVPLSLGICANTVGTVLGGGAHTREEWVDLSSMPMGQAIALGLMLPYTE